MDDGELAAREHARRFGRRPHGMWLAECGYMRGVDELLRESGIRYFFVDALDQAGRELLLAQASDWTFIMKTGTVTQYAVRRVGDHVSRFNALYDALRTGSIHEPWLKDLEERDNLFPDLDYRIYTR